MPHGPDGRPQTEELRGVAARLHGARPHVEDVPAQQHQVGILGVEQVHPAGQLDAGQW